MLELKRFFFKLTEIEYIKNIITATKYNKI